MNANGNGGNWNGGGSPDLVRALGILEGSFDSMRNQNSQQHMENRQALEEISAKVDDLVKWKHMAVGIIAGASLAGGVVGAKMAAILRFLG